METTQPTQTQTPAKQTLRKLAVIATYQLSRGIKIPIKERAPAGFGFFILESNGDIFYITKAKRTLVWSNGAKTPAMSDMIFSKLVRSGVSRA